jgi:hypothetical protein
LCSALRGAEALSRVSFQLLQLLDVSLVDRVLAMADEVFAVATKVRAHARLRTCCLRRLTARRRARAFASPRLSTRCARWQRRCSAHPVTHACARQIVQVLMSNFDLYQRDKCVLWYLDALDRHGLRAELEAIAARPSVKLHAKLPAKL